MTKHFTQSQLEAIAGAIGDTNDGLTGSEIGHLLASCKMKDPDPALTKRHRLYNALALSQNERQDRLAVLAFIRKTMKPERFARDPERFEPLRANFNLALAFAGLRVTEAGEIENSDKAATLSEAKRRAEELRADLSIRGAHPDVLRFCREELLADNYFHAVLEAVKRAKRYVQRLASQMTEDRSSTGRLAALRRCLQLTRCSVKARSANREGLPTSFAAPSGCFGIRPLMLHELRGT